MTSDDERVLEEQLLERLRSSRVPLHLWQLGYGDHNVERALFRLRKRGLVVRHKNGPKRGWSLR